MLFVCLQNGHQESLQLLLKASGGEIETDDHSRTLVHHAAYHGQVRGQSRVLGCASLMIARTTPNALCVF